VTSGPPSADWYPDPGGSSRERYWDGERWTKQLRPGPQSAAMPQQQAWPPASTDCPQGAQVNGGNQYWQCQPPGQPPPVSDPILRGKDMQLRRFWSGVVWAALTGCWVVITAMTPVAIAEPGHIPAPMGPVLGQSCDDPLKLAYDPSAGEIVCSRSGEWVQSVNPTAVRLLGAPCPPSESDSQLIAKTPDDHMIKCPSGVWSLYRP
jgi:hypothetical protein